MNNQPSQDVAFYGKMLTFSRVRLNTDDFDIIKKQLEIVSPSKDSKIPVVIESEVEQDLEKLVDLLWSWGLQPIGVVSGLLDEQANKLKMALFPADGKRIERITPTHKTSNAPISKKSEEPAKATTIKSELDVEDSTKNIVDIKTNKDESLSIDTDRVESNNQNIDSSIQLIKSNDNESKLNNNQFTYSQHVDSITSLVYDKMLRSGQSINHVGGDLIITNTVNNGSEVITDNNLHIYGKGLGRLVAGATGDKDAHIFCQVFNPTLVSVAGTYCLRDNIPEEYIDKPVHVSYKEGDGLIYRIMKI